MGQKFGIPRVRTKFFLGIWEALTAVPRVILEMTISVHDLALPDNDPEKDDGKAMRHMAESIAGFVASLSFGVAAVTDGNPEAEEICVVALAVMGISLVTKYGIQSAGFIVEHRGY